VARDGDRDGIPNVLLEAMAMGLPVVSTGHSSIPELVQDRRNGLLVEPGDRDALTSALAALLDDPALCRRMGQAGRRKVSQDFDVQRNVRQLFDMFVHSVGG
jgi:colanic acid/amylovoran biosynthesis glycosyltransferase